MKNCQRCNVTKPLEDFGKRKSSKDGKAATCKKCSNARLKTRRKGLLDSELHAFRVQQNRRKELPKHIGYCHGCLQEFTVTCNGRSICQKCVNKAKKEKYSTNIKNRVKKQKYYRDNINHITLRF